MYRRHCCFDYSHYTHGSSRGVPASSVHLVFQWLLEHVECHIYEAVLYIDHRLDAVDTLNLCQRRRMQPSSI